MQYLNSCRQAPLLYQPQVQLSVRCFARKIGRSSPPSPTPASSSPPTPLGKLNLITNKLNFSFSFFWKIFKVKWSYLGTDEATDERSAGNIGFLTFAPGVLALTFSLKPLTAAIRRSELQSDAVLPKLEPDESDQPADAVPSPACLCQCLSGKFNSTSWLSGRANPILTTTPEKN